MLKYNILRKKYSEFDGINVPQTSWNGAKFATVQHYLYF